MRHHQHLLLAILPLAALVAGCGPRERAAAPRAPAARAVARPQWPDPRGPSLNGASPYAGRRTPHLKWEVKLPWPYVLSPVIGRDGTIYVASDSGPAFGKKPRGGVFSAVTPQGKVKWQLSSEGAYSAAALAQDGTIYVAREFGKLFALSPDGKVRWQADYQYFSDAHVPGIPPLAPTVGPEGAVYVVGNGLVAFTPSGRKKWETTQHVYSRPVFGRDGTIYVATESDSPNGSWVLVALTPDKRVVWQVKDVGHPVVGRDGIIYGDSEDGTIRAVSPEGKVKWKVPMGSPPGAGPSVGPDATVYCTTESSEMPAITPQGKVKYRARLPELVLWSSPVGGPDGVAYLAGKYCYAFEPNGGERWRFPVTKGQPAWGPESAIAFDGSGTLYVTAYPARLIAIDNQAASK